MPGRNAPRPDAPRMGAPPEPGHPAPPPDWQLWLGVLGAPGLWLLHFLLFYLAVEVICRIDTGEAVGGWVLGGATLLFAAGALALTVFAWRLVRRTSRSSQTYDDFLPHVGVIIGAMSTFSLLMEAMPLLFVSICA